MRWLNAKRRHAVYDLGPDLLLVFKPRGHAEPEHAHPRAQRIELLTGRLEVVIGDRRIVLAPRNPSIRIAARERHRTHATRAAWLIVRRS